MKKIRKFFKKLNNRGSSLVMVIISLAFIGIVVGALLTAAGFAYRMRLQDLNSRDNFYYLEQAMNEVYTGVGSETVKCMQDAYTYTIENMVRYDVKTGSYQTIDKEKANEIFSDKYMNNIQNSEFFKNGQVELAKNIRNLISNRSIDLDEKLMKIELVPGAKAGSISQLIIRNVTLRRTVDYNRAAAGRYTQSITTDIVIGSPKFDVSFDATDDSDLNIFTYSLVADMGVEVKSTVPLSISGNLYAASDFYNKKYNYAGLDPEFTTSSEEVQVKYTTKDDEGNETQHVKYKHNAISSRQSNPADANTLVGSDYYYEDADRHLQYYFDGGTGETVKTITDPNNQKRSLYSGLYVDGSDVNILADYVIVPGTVAVMNHGSFSVFGRNGTSTSNAEVWADNIVLGGSSLKRTYENTEGKTVTNYVGADGVFRGNLYIKDDTEINAPGSTFELKGGYFGYGDSTSRDNREFLPQIDENFQVENADGTKTNRGHYNSSSIVINGDDSHLDLSTASTIFLAGRSYIELSKKRTDNVDVTPKDEDGNVLPITAKDSNGVSHNDYHDITNTYEYRVETEDSTSAEKKIIRDYKTGESISVKSNQLAYVPIQVKTTPSMYKFEFNDYESLVVEIDPAFAVGGMSAKSEYVAGYSMRQLVYGFFFGKYFPSVIFAADDGPGKTTVYRIPVISQKVDGKTTYYYDFETAYNMMLDYTTSTATMFGDDTFKNLYPSPQHFAQAFIEDYVAELNKPDSEISEDEKTLRAYLTDIRDYEDFKVAEVVVPENPTGGIYASGAITARDDESFTITAADSYSELAQIINNTPYDSAATVSTTDVGNWLNSSVNVSSRRGELVSLYSLSDDIEAEYNYMKWNLGHFNVGNADDMKEKTYIDEVLDDSDYGEAAITPINRFINVEKLASNIDIKPLAADTETTVTNNGLHLDSGYKVWLSGARDNKKIEIKADATDNGVVRGIVVTRGDVIFNSNVKSFEGLIIAGGKVVIDNNYLSQITASPEICKAVLRECMFSGDPDAKIVLAAFKGYEQYVGMDNSISEEDQEAAKKIENIDYSDVVWFDNWKKNVE
ncbi:MAG: hypothetical protein IKO61_08695 [Lachnospiraceae bacterium]|nr:hypothetical protein [Lachnospiraceae bacterium]